MKQELKDGVLVITLEGNLLGEHTNNPVLEKLKEEIEKGNKKILLNLSDVKFVNSTGLGMLLTAVTKTRSAGGELTLSNLTDQMKKPLQMTKLENIFNAQ